MKTSFSILQLTALLVAVVSAAPIAPAAGLSTRDIPPHASILVPITQLDVRSLEARAPEDTQIDYEALMRDPEAFKKEIQERVARRESEVQTKRDELAEKVKEKEAAEAN